MQQQQRQLGAVSATAAAAQLKHASAGVIEKPTRDPREYAAMIAFNEAAVAANERAMSLLMTTTANTTAAGAFM